MTSRRATIEFEDWYRQSWPALRHSLTISTGDAELAEDLASEAFARAYARWDAVARMESPTGWTTTVAYNLMRSRWRRDRVAARWQATRRRSTEVVLPEMDPDLWRAVDNLPPRARQMVALRYVLDLTQPEIAQVLGIAPGTVASTLHDARRALAEALWPDGRVDEDTEVSHHGR